MEYIYLSDEHNSELSEPVVSSRASGLQRESWPTPRQGLTLNYMVSVYFHLYFKSLTRKHLSDFIIGSPLPLPKLLSHPSRLVLKFLVNGVDEHYEQVLSTRGDTEDGIWEIDGNVNM